MRRDGEYISADLVVLARRERAIAGDPKVLELKEAAKAIIEENPEWRSSQTQKRFFDEEYDLIIIV